MPNRKEPQLNLEPRLDPAQPHPSPTEAKAPLTSARYQPAATSEAQKAADAASATTQPAVGASVARAKLANQSQDAQAHPEAVLRRAAALRQERLAQQAAPAASASAAQQSQTAAPASAAAPDSQSASMQQQRATAKAEAPESLAASGGKEPSGGGGNHGGDGHAAASGKQGLGWFAAGLLVVLMLGGLGGWQLMTLNQQLQAQIGDLEAALSDRLEELEVRLLETDEGLSQTGQTFRGRLDWADEEIHKLWRLANNRMRPAISELQEQVSPLPEQITRLESAIQPLPNRVSQLQREQQALGERLSAQQSEAQEVQRRLQQQVQQVEQQMMEASLMLTALNEQVRNRAAQEQINELQAQVQGLVDQWRTELQPQLASQTEQLNSLDLSRQQLVSRVTQLMDEMGELYQRLGQSAP
ncbi:hypothetical protein V6U78_02470 [Marinospirillum sp. MEB164]|uniref:Uroporphyrin-3 C-methyltransferase n=1 Tax=Marinospirillum alkalitolerans TaxID=3123374 RepID=A0ABW8PW68_9GAMM